MSVNGMMRTVFATELRALQPELSDASLRYILDSILVFQAEAISQCQLIVAKAATTYRENPGMGFSSTIEDKTAKELKQELSKELENYAERVKAGEV